MKKNDAKYMNLVGHELRTPLVPLFGYLSMILEEKGLNNTIRKRLKICMESVKKELAIIQDFIDNSKMEAGILKLDIENIDMGSLFNAVKKQVLPALHRDKLYIRVNTQANLPLIKGDAIRLRQAITNLVNNAMRLTEKGGITLSAEKKANNILITISDTGIGLKKKDFNNIFNKFYKINMANDKKDYGTGIEMTISKQIIELHKGKIWLKNKPGKGTTACLTIPIYK